MEELNIKKPFRTARRLVIPAIYRRGIKSLNNFDML
jgi:hypothetical protein